jgi:membrane-associated phospholipid phosphatase
MLYIVLIFYAESLRVLASSASASTSERSNPLLLQSTAYNTYKLLINYIHPYIRKLPMAQANTRLYWLFQSLMDFVPYLLAGLLADMLVLALGVFIARLLLWDWLLPFEESCLLILKEWSNPTRDRYMIALTWMAQGEITIPILIAIAGILIYRDDAVPALILAIGLSGSWLLNGIFKSFFRRKRPDLWASSKRPRDYSYPSGHSMSAISFYGLLAAILTQSLGISLWLTVPVAAFLTLGVGFSRVYLGVHWPTDVLSGWVAGGIWLGSCLYGLAQIKGI